MPFHDHEALRPTAEREVSTLEKAGHFAAVGAGAAVGITTGAVLGAIGGPMGIASGAVAGGSALAREAVAAADNPRSTYLRQLRRDGKELTSASVIEAARHADPVAMELLTASAALVGDALAGMVNLLNPSIIVLGGSVGRSLDLYLATVRRAVLNRSLPLATRSLQIVTSPLADRAGLIGAAYTVLDELFSPAILASWIDMGQPGELPQMTA